ncbi:unnamed protein product [Dibothriocephalus latus]|uniref:Integrase catalytic domain-containing protein n=1 Tax=Dibothriocephalus latus TaxID=60516 RepID=A0A3P7P666_DIBLA|nr:unnamed protein product [Dibothriocephalus latus]
MLREVGDMLQIYKTHTTPFHPEGNGQVERTKGTLNNLLKAFTRDHHPLDWDQRLPCALMAYRAMVYSSTGYTPFMMITRRTFRLPIDSLTPQPSPAFQSTNDNVLYLQELLRLTYNLARRIVKVLQPLGGAIPRRRRHLSVHTNDYVLQLQELLRLTYNLARSHLETAYDRQKNDFDRQTFGSPYVEGDLVWKYRSVPLLGTSSNFFNHWEGSYRVVDVIHPSTYVLQDRQPSRLPFTAHFDKLKPYRCQLPMATAEVTPVIPPHLVAIPVREETVETKIATGPADRAPSEEGSV